MRNFSFSFLLMFSSLSFFNALARNNFFDEPNRNVIFIENKGQLHDQNFHSRNDVLYYGKSDGFTFHFTKEGISYQFIKLIDEKSNLCSIYRVDVNWELCNSNLSIQPANERTETINYYLNSDINGIKNVRMFDELNVHNVYNGIDLKYYQSENKLKYDFILQPEVNYQQIKLKISGAIPEISNEGDLLLKTPFGTITEEKPITIQNGNKLESTWKIIDQNTVAYSIKNIDSSSGLIIDPVARVWGTYYGDAGADYGYSCATDASNNLFVVGKTASWVNIATVGAHQATFNGGSDAFVLKMNPNGVRQWCTYYGGIGNEVANGCAINSLGEVYVVGNTQSSTGISTPGAHQNTYGGGSNDAFIAKFNTNGLRLWASYYGGPSDDGGGSCAIDAMGNVYMCGYSGSTVNIATSGVHQSTIGAGPNDMMLIKFSSSGNRLWGTYYGGTNNDFANSCKIDASGNIYMLGSTQSSNNISLGAVNQTTLGGNYDACLSKFNSSGLLTWATYVGGNGLDYGYCCTLDATGNIYISGSTQSTTNISSIGAHQLSNGGMNDGFLQKYNSSGGLVWGTYYGGIGNDNALSNCIDQSGNIYIVGQTLSGNNIATINGIQTSYSGGVYDGYMAIFNSSGTRQYATYYGGTADEGAYGVVADGLGNIYMSGYSSSNNNISTPLAHQPNNAGLFDAFVVKFGNCSPISINTNVNSPVCAGSNVTFSATSTGSLSLNYNWYGPNTFTSSIQNPTITNAQVGNSGTYTVVAFDAGGCSETATVSLTISACTGLNQMEVKLNEMEIYPNPCTNELFIKCSNNEERITFQITDAIGKVLQSELIQIHSGIGKVELNILPGIYFVNLMNTNGQHFAQKLIITR